MKELKSVGREERIAERPVKRDEKIGVNKEKRIVKTDEKLGKSGERAAEAISKKHSPGNRPLQ